MDIAKPFSHRPRLMPCLCAQMGPCHIRPLWLRSSANNESYRRHVPMTKFDTGLTRLHEADDDAANKQNNMATTAFVKW